MISCGSVNEHKEVVLMTIQKQAMNVLLLIMLAVCGASAASAVPAVFSIEHPSIHWTVDGVNIYQFRTLTMLEDNIYFTIYGENILQNGVKVAERIYFISKTADFLNTAENQTAAARSLSDDANMSGMTFIKTAYTESTYVSLLANNTNTTAPLTFPGYGPNWVKPPASFFK
jgi:hypothetical protein